MYEDGVLEKNLVQELLRMIAETKFQMRKAVSPNVRNSSGFNFSVKSSSFVGLAAHINRAQQKIGSFQ